MGYTVGEMAKMIEVPASTLRYYDKQGLLPFVERSPGGIRLFQEKDYEWLQIIICLKKTGMPLNDIRDFINMAMQGDATIETRLELIIRQQHAVQAQIDELQNTMEILNYKQWYYETAKQAGSTAVPRNLPIDMIPEKYRTVRQSLRKVPDDEASDTEI